MTSWTAKCPECGEIEGLFFYNHDIEGDNPTKCWKCQTEFKIKLQLIKLKPKKKKEK